MGKHDPVTRPITIAIPYVYGASVRLERTGPDISFSGKTDSSGAFTVENFPADVTAVNIHVDAAGYQHYDNVLQFSNNINVIVIGKWPTTIPADWMEVTGLVYSFPAVPSRDKVCAVNIQFQGEVITVDDVAYPWFEPGVQCLNAAQRQQVYQQKKANGDTHCIIEFLPGGSIYDEPGNPYQKFISPNFEYNPLAFLTIIEEIIIAGLTPGVVFNGDNGDNPNDGYPNALRQLPILVNLLRGSQYGDLNQYVLYLRFWDGVFYGSTPANIANFGAQFRALLPNGYLGIEHQPGRIPVGGAERDYQPGGAMVGYDVIFSEFADEGNGPSTGNNTLWQVIGRMIRPYNRPADQVGDPNPPFYLAGGNARGPYYYCAFEYNTTYGIYAWVRVNMNNYQPLQQQINARRQYIRNMGVQYNG